ncbi:MAG: alpha/beta fold hydrolase [Deltaproteobacteria bacterium]|nr:alpha/beta fold hydrolase [Deltaproteobacteria bacterium]
MVRLRTGFPFSSGHVHTIFPPLFRPRPRLEYQRQRVETADGDFVDVDWHCRGSDHLVIILHGLEGHSRRTYVLGMARAARDHGFDVLAMNLRGCSGEPNRKLPSYHSGLTEDLHDVLRMVRALNRYASCFLIGFSLGANLVLKYLGEAPERVPVEVRGAVAVSVPCDLEDSAQSLARPGCRFYMRYLLDQLGRKVIEKERLFPGAVDLAALRHVHTFREFDDLCTAPWHGFRDALDYWRKSSSKQFLVAIDRPTCIINALDDPFLGPKCFPEWEVECNPFLILITPPVGGHVGFVGTGDMYWSEWQSMRFLTSLRQD